MWFEPFLYELRAAEQRVYYWFRPNPAMANMQQNVAKTPWTIVFPDARTDAAFRPPLRGAITH